VNPGHHVTEDKFVDAKIAFKSHNPGGWHIEIEEIINSLLLLANWIGKFALIPNPMGYDFAIVALEKGHDRLNGLGQIATNFARVQNQHTFVKAVRC
jgi:hypothetical protein